MRNLTTAGKVSKAAGWMPRAGVVFGRTHGKVYALSRGRLGRRWFGMPVLVLHTVGRKSGAARQTSLIYVTRGEEIVVVAANGGQAHSPAWVLNLLGAGRGEVELPGGERFPVAARLTAGDERRELWDRMAAAYPTADEYLTFSDREYQVVVLSRPPAVA